MIKNARVINFWNQLRNNENSNIQIFKKGRQEHLFLLACCNTPKFIFNYLINYLWLLVNCDGLYDAWCGFIDVYCGGYWRVKRLIRVFGI